MKHGGDQSARPMAFLSFFILHFTFKTTDLFVFCCCDVNCDEGRQIFFHLYYIATNKIQVEKRMEILQEGENQRKNVHYNNLVAYAFSLCE